MPNNEYIKRKDALFELYRYASAKDPALMIAYRVDLSERIEKIPAADVEQVKHGRWMQVPGKQARVCSRCEMDEPYKFADEDTNIYSWCPHCGAKMNRKANDE